MKKAILLFAIFCVLAGGGAAQQIQSSPIEGRWVWDGGEDDRLFSEMIFFGNAMLYLWDDEPFYGGMLVTLTDNAIRFNDDYDGWQYSLSGSVLNIVTEDDEQFSFTRAATHRSPLQGIWKVTGGDYFDPDEDDEDFYFIFFGDLMAEHYYGYGLEGFKMEFSGNTFRPTRDAMKSLEGDAFTEEDWREYAVEYRVSGNSLTFSFSDGESIRLTKVY